MGAVYRCMHVEFNYPAAIKILLPAATGADPYGRERMRREALIARRLNHPNLVQVHDCGTNVTVVNDDKGSHRYEEFFLVMDLLEGQSLRDYLHHQGALPLKEALAIVRQVANGLAELHSKGILHRDIKPANIMLTRDHKGDLLVKIVDLGAVKFVERSMAFDDVELTGNLMVGSARYTSPENCKGLPLDERSDIYCLGLVLYEMLAGQPVFASKDRVDLIYKQAHIEPPSLDEYCPEVPEPVLRLVMSSLEKSPENRPQSAAELARTLLSLEASVRTDKVFSNLHTEAGEIAEETEVVVRPASSLTDVEQQAGETERGDARQQYGQRNNGAGMALPSDGVKSNPASIKRPSSIHQGRRVALGLAYFLAFIMTAAFLSWSLLSRAPATARAGGAPTSSTLIGTQANNPGDEFITTTDVNVRSGPGKANQKVGLAEKGSRVRVLSASGNWREVIVLQHGRPKEDESSLDQGWVDGGLLNSPEN